MNGVVKDALRKSFLDVQYQHAEAVLFLGIMYRFVELLLQEPDLEAACRKILRILTEETQFDNCSILLWNTQEGCLSLKAAFGLRDLLIEKEPALYHKELRFKPSEWIAGKVFTTRRPVFIEDGSQDAIPLKDGATVQPASLACLPLLDIGVLNISSLSPHQFSTHTKQNWDLLSRIIGYIIKKASHKWSAETVGTVCEQRVAVNVDSDNMASLSDRAIELSPQGICLLDSEGCIIRMNKSMKRLHGEGVVDLVGRSPAALFRVPQLFTALMRKMEDREQEEMTDVELTNSSGECYLADVYLRKLTCEDGSLTGYLLTLDDITKKVVSLKKSNQSEKLAALGTMAGGVAHDFNNLLMAVLGNIQLILPLISDAEVRDRLERIEKAAQDGAHTVRRLQRFTERGKELSTPAEGSDVSEAIKDVVEMTRPRWKNLMEKNGHTIEVQMELDARCFAAMNSSDLREVLTNLVLNAVEAMPQGGLISIRCFNNHDNVVIEITDTGMGMNDEVIERIFDPFFSTKGTGNSGLGLSVSWSLVVQCRGEIQVKSRPARGTSFIIKLPKAEVSPPQHAAEPEAVRSASSHKLLLVEDDAEVLGILRDMLRLKGHHVTATDDGEKALDMIANEKFDLVITDLGMPVVSGWDIAKHAKGKDVNTPVVLITGWGAQYEEEDVSKRGIDLVLSKPLRWENLLEAIERLI